MFQMQQNILIVVVCSFFFVYAIFYFSDAYENDQSSSTHIGKLIRPADGVVGQKIFDSCPIREWPEDGWTEEMRKVARPDTSPIKDCNRNFVPPTTFLEGQVHVNLSVTTKPGAAFNFTDKDCKARALIHVDDFAFDQREWHPLDENHTFTNDIVNVKCTANNGSATVYEFLHTQIWRDRQKYPMDDRSAKKLPNIHIIVIDSLANTQALRSMPKTIEYLRKEFGAINFKHVNKVGVNSRPNGLPAFFGKSVRPIDRTLFGLGIEKEDWGYQQYCNEYFNRKDDPFVLVHMQKMGYTTMMSEDWANGVINWPNCYGYKAQPTDHYMRPFQIYYERNTNFSHEFMRLKNCYIEYNFQLDYLEQFLNAYKDRPKASLTWSSTFSHDYADVIFHVDGTYQRLFEKYKDEFNNSFLIFMGDHGMRWGPNRWTEIGEDENNNPMFFVSVPSFLRSNDELIRNMNENAEKLLSMFDVYETLADLYSKIPNSNFQDFAPSKYDPKAKGYSMFRKIPDFPRNCKTLPIPFEFCLCYYKRVPIEDPLRSAHIGDAVALALNDFMDHANVSHLCQQLKPVKVSDVQLLVDSRVYQATVKTTPGDGEFRVYVIDHSETTEPNFAIAEASVPRLNSYGHDADCLHGVNDELRPYCYCRNIKPTPAPRR